MKTRLPTRWRKVAAAALTVPATLLAAQGASAQPISNDWQFHAIIYAFLPEIGGSTKFPVETGGSSVNVDADTILNNLKFAFMGSLEAQKGYWGAFTDVMYLDVGGSKSNTRNVSIGGVDLPGGITSDLSLDIKGTAWTLGGSYRWLATTDASGDVFVGARLLSLKERLGWKFSADFDGITGPLRENSNEQKIDNWDGIIGAKGRVALGQGSKWYVPYYVDVGTGDSDLTWQAMAGIGYAFDGWNLLAAWRYLDYDFKSSQKIESVTFNGPMIGVGFTW